MTYKQIENWLKDHSDADCIDIEFSGMSKSSYISFCNPEGDIFKIRLSNHDLPACYNNDSDFDVRFKDSWTQLKKDIVRTCGIKKVVKPRTKEEMPSEEEVSFLKTEFEKLGRSMKRLAGAYQLSDKKREYLINEFIK